MYAGVQRLFIFFGHIFDHSEKVLHLFLLVIIFIGRANLCDILTLKSCLFMRFIIEKEVVQGDSYESKNNDFLKIFKFNLNHLI